MSMCDLIVAVGGATKNGTVIFGKNSDRPPNEPQLLVHYPRRRHRNGSSVKCQLIEIPQVDVTFEVLGSRPYWCWGFEHGVNEFGVAIGNAAVHSKEPFESPEGKAGLIGMDLVRLGLERGRSAYESMRVIIDLLERYGPGSLGRARYHNNFLIADADEAWVLETAGRYWVAEKITDGVRAVSNLYTIGDEWNAAHPDLVEHAVEMGWCGSREDFNFARAYYDYENYSISSSLIRWRRATSLLRSNEGKITIKTFMEILRDHREGTFLGPLWTPGEDFYASLCCHERPWSRGQTAASIVVELRGDMPDILRSSCWVCMAAPCVSVFHPLYVKEVEFPSELSIGDERFSEDSPWWRFKRLQRHVERNYAFFAPIVREVWRGFERMELDRIKALERESIELMKAGKREEAVRKLQRFVKEMCDLSLNLAEELDIFLRRLDSLLPKYHDLRGEYLDRLDEEVGLKRDGPRRNR